MSRVIADLLGAHDPSFRFGLAELERAAGMSSTDIRLGVEITTAVREKLLALGLDPQNTTGPELFRALQERLVDDEQHVRQALGLSEDASSNDVLVAVHHFLVKETVGKKVFALKQTVLRAILKKLKPKATMKALGYRSMESMFKHESVLQLVVATELIESNEWHKARREAYKKLQPKDFELRDVMYVLPTGKHWPELARRYTERRKHNLIVSTEMGGVVLLPLEVELPGLTIASIILGFQAFEDIRAQSALLKLHHVEPHFSQVFQDMLDHEPVTELTLASHPITWKFAHWFYGSGLAPYHPDLFEPHLPPEDFAAHDVHASLKSLHEALGFWQGGDMLALLDEKGTPVSFNVLDVALGVCNGIEYSARFIYNMQATLRRELLGRYLGHESLHAMLEDALGKQFNLIPELSFDDE